MDNPDLIPTLGIVIFLIAILVRVIIGKLSKRRD
jgi:hypothetical protein